MERYRRRPRVEKKSPTRRRIAIGGAAIAAALVGWWLLGGAGSAVRSTRERHLEDDQRYVIEERNWADLTPTATAPAVEQDPEEAARERYRAEQWQNLDIAISDR